jgi:hypothetical protein
MVVLRCLPCGWQDGLPVWLEVVTSWLYTYKDDGIIITWEHDNCYLNL